jgi:hypothetical protein
MSDDIDDDAAQRESDDLRALWSALPAPRSGVEADGLPSEDAAASDDLTRAAIEHLRAAWGAHAVEVPELPFALRSAHAHAHAHAQRLALRSNNTAQQLALRSNNTAQQLALRSHSTARQLGRIAPPPRRARTTPMLRILALAAAAAAAVLIFALRDERTSHDIERTGEGPLVAGGGDIRGGPGTDAPRELEPSPLPAESVATLVDIPREDFKSRVDGFEFEAQGVRFVFIETTGEAPSSAPATRKD